MPVDDALTSLQRWYLAHCDGSWEHQHGIDIANIDNPGWILAVGVEGTELESADFPARRENFEHDSDWLTCSKEGKKFLANGGALMLTRMIEIFLEWAAQHERPAKPIVHAP